MPNDPPVCEPRSDELPQDISAFLKYPFLGRPRLRSDMNSGEFNGKLQRAQSNSKIYLIHLNWVIAEVSWLNGHATADGVPAERAQN